MLVIGGIWIYTKTSNFHEEAKLTEKKLTEEARIKVKQNVAIATSFITYQNSYAETQLKEKLQELVDQAHIIATNIYTKNKGKLNNQEIQKRIFTAIEPLRLYKKRPYVFIISLKGDGIFFPKNSQGYKFIGKNLLNIKDLYGNYFVQSEIDKIQHQDTAFIRYSNLGNQLNNFNFPIKISYVKKFKPYNWYMGSFAFVNDVYNELQTNAIKNIKQILQNKTLTIYNEKGICIYNSLNPFLEGQNYKDFTNRHLIEFIDTLKKNPPLKSDFYNHKYSEEKQQTTYISYVRGWNWFIGSYFYQQDIEKKIATAKKKLQQTIKFNILQIILIIFIASIVFLFSAKIIASRMHTSFKHFQHFFKKLSRDNIMINSEQQYFSEFRDLAVIINKMLEIRLQKEAQLKEALIKAEESERLKSAFLANMSHEIKTPMNAIIAFSEILNDDSLSCESRQEILGHIRSSGNSLLLLINDIIDKSIIDAGKLKITKTNCSINSLFDKLQNTFNEIKKQSNKTNLSLNFIKELPDKDAFVYTDPLRLKQILNNLIGNAIKFTPEDGSITITYQKKNNAFIFSVTDTGIGIPFHLQEIIFDRFRQADESHTRQFGGTGLGLAISKRLTQLLGGKIWVNSSPKKGSTFSFFIPCTEEKEKTENLLQLIKNNYKIPDLNDKKILIIDDNKINRLQLIQTLNNTHATIDEIDNLKQAVTLCQENNYHFVFLNLKLRETKEYDILIKHHRNILFAIEEKDSPIRTEEILDLGFNGYIEKPIIGNRVIQLIETIQ